MYTDTYIDGMVARRKYLLGFSYEFSICIYLYTDEFSICIYVY